eukprot:CAMPEP_0197532098 /NCGR_PEP_ID=MMETSP1318-20131121/38494_1 /TAXON_ID=552666 /ORGANISM="Partenskyella glossopodia, Strain RCC365" /LENGTH=268 /DNA_ID=CAMNT_0043088555 /DNA_START=32 /DNA_END=834 /DNA_ORIENTATION=+
MSEPEPGGAKKKRRLSARECVDACSSAIAEATNATPPNTDSSLPAAVGDDSKEEQDVISDLQESDDEDEDDWTLSDAIECDRVEIVRSLVENKADVSSFAALAEQFYYGFPLGLAAKHGAHRCIEYLIRAKADVNQKDSAGRPALCWADTFRTVEILIEAGAEFKFAIVHMRRHIETMNEYDAEREMRIPAFTFRTIDSFICQFPGELYASVCSQKLALCKYLRYFECLAASKEANEEVKRLTLTLTIYRDFPSSLRMLRSELIKAIG